MADKSAAERLCELANRVADTRDADILLYNGEIVWNWNPDENIIDMCNARPRRKNVMLILVTHGGDPDAAYRIARCLQQKYDRFSLYVPGYCKSAGTLIALGAHEIVMSDLGELGPLDIQLSKPDELFEAGSGLDTIQALSYLREVTFQMFEDNARDLKYDHRGQITFKTAMQLASDLTTGLFKPVYEQIEPTRLGEVARQMTIAEDYGDRLIKASGNLKDGALNNLLAAFPSHGFVIDRHEAERLFNRVKEPTAEEKELADLLSKSARVPSMKKRFVAFISSIAEEEGEEEHEGQDERGDLEGTRGEAGATSGDAEGDLLAEIAENGQRNRRIPQS